MCCVLYRIPSKTCLLGVSISRRVNPDTNKALQNAKTIPENFPLPPTEPLISPQKKCWSFSPFSEN